MIGFHFFELGATCAFVVSEKLGRKLAIILSGCMIAIGAILQLIGHLGLLYGGRALIGLGVGLDIAMFRQITLTFVSEHHLW